MVVKKNRQMINAWDDSRKWSHRFYIYFESSLYPIKVCMSTSLIKSKSLSKIETNSLILKLRCFNYCSAKISKAMHSFLIFSLLVNEYIYISCFKYFEISTKELNWATNINYFTYLPYLPILGVKYLKFTHLWCFKNTIKDLLTIVTMFWNFWENS